MLFAFAGDLPQISALDDYAPSTITRVYASTARSIGEFADRAARGRSATTQISPLLRQAIIAAEDAGFDSHFGAQHPAHRSSRCAQGHHLPRTASGASTLTQQLARNLFLTHREDAGERKIKEAILTIQIEKRYTKREILTLYCNHILFGHGTYGVEAAARLYFGKSAKDLTLEEAALLAGIIQARRGRART